MSEADAFLDAIFATPDDDLPRLVYADWLEEHGLPEYAAFIRASCDHARADPSSPLRSARKAAGERCYRAFRTFTEANPEVFKGLYLGMGDFDRGIPPLVLHVDASVFLAQHRHWWPLVRPVALWITQYSGHEVEVANTPYLERLSELTFTPYASIVEDNAYPLWEPIPDGRVLLAALASSPQTKGLSDLRVAGLRPTAADLESFAQSELAKRLPAVDFTVVLDDFNEVRLQVGSGYATAPVPEMINDFLTDYGHRLIPPTAPKRV